MLGLLWDELYSTSGIYTKRKSFECRRYIVQDNNGLFYNRKVHRDELCEYDLIHGGFYRNGLVRKKGLNRV